VLELVCWYGVKLVWLLWCWGNGGCGVLSYLFIWWSGGNELLLRFKVQCTMQQGKRISVEDYAKLGEVLNRRQQPVSAGYLYRLIREHIKGKRSALPFDYELTGEKDRIYIVR
jgi:hypothetical protein